ncbi:recombinase family protein [Microbacterium sp. bgisy203]|uniref:recombinase family protein n=1 Tax=Microbacterium sp. bgisy203 TaxID=3413799 RepID=UPI003D73314B
MSALRVGYARCSTAEQDLEVQRRELATLGVDPDRIYVDHGLSGATRDRPGLREALAAVRDGDVLVVTKLDRLARSVRDASEIVEDLTVRGVVLQIGTSVHNPHDPIGRLLFNVLAMVAEFESDLIRARTREGMAVARAKGRLRGRAPKLTRSQRALLVDLHAKQTHSVQEICELFGISRATVYRELERARTTEGVTDRDSARERA